MENHAPSLNVLLLPPDQIKRLAEYFKILIEIDCKNKRDLLKELKNHE